YQRTLRGKADAGRILRAVVHRINSGWRWVKNIVGCYPTPVSYPCVKILSFPLLSSYLAF
ncbi:MAG TPA: hypothetical protein PKD70_15940, partial [Saprospiraceae bacterium]|nr:hypothetical protein [Saprospiraceae bacterium]HMP15369.1 hypothetical protein [Saprospiraceae bacterium]